MRTIERSTQFKRDFKRVVKQIGATEAERLLNEALKYLLNDVALPIRYKDHKLTHKGELRDCHLRPDLVLLYEQTKSNVLRLARLGSHSEVL